MIVGTAGHIDHGKTALVRALTDIDTDRLPEEKRRGISIDLGFAYAPLVEGSVTGFVDVPGHERFVHTMAAGAAGIDVVLLAVAADDGVMPQTREHLAILDLLGVQRGIVALTKSDRADGERRAVVMAEIRAALAETGLQGAPILPVSIVSGEGLGDLRAALAQTERDTITRGQGGAFRLAVDRCFTLAGAGTIVTGTVMSGTVSVGDSVVVSPAGLRARVRSIHAQNQPAQRGVAGQRCALNLVGERITSDAIERGDIVLDPSLHAPTARIDATLRVLAGESKAVGTWLPVRLHHASREVGARVVPLAGVIEPGGSGPVQLMLEQPIAAAAGDRFVLRDTSAQRTLGGGRFLDLRPPARKRRTPERLAVITALDEADLGGVVRRLLAIPPHGLDLASFARDRAVTSDWLMSQVDLVTICLDAGGIRFALAPDPWGRFAAGLVAEVLAFHEQQPDLQGIGREQLRLRVEPRLPPPVFAVALGRLVQAGSVVLDGAFVRAPSHAVVLSEADENLWTAVSLHLQGIERFRPPRVRDLAALFEQPETELRRMLQRCARLGRVDEIAADHFFGRATTIEMAGLVREAAAVNPDGWVTAAVLRDRLDNGRKVAIQILDFFDRHGVTMRRGDKRRINPHRLDVFGPVAGLEGRDTSPVGRPDFKSG